MTKPNIRFNGGWGALLCSKCNIIIEQGPHVFNIKVGQLCEKCKLKEHESI